MIWPDIESEFQQAARSAYLAEMAGQANYWIQYAEDFLTNPQPAKPHERSWSEVAKKDRNYRDVFQTLTQDQKDQVRVLLEECISGAVFSSLCVLDQFPGGEAEVWVRDGYGEEGKRKVLIAGVSMEELHDEFYDHYKKEKITEQDAPSNGG